MLFYSKPSFVVFIRPPIEYVIKASHSILYHGAEAQGISQKLALKSLGMFRKQQSPLASSFLPYSCVETLSTYSQHSGLQQYSNFTHPARPGLPGHVRNGGIPAVANTHSVSAQFPFGIYCRLRHSRLVPSPKCSHITRLLPHVNQSAHVTSLRRLYAQKWLHASPLCRL